jgi:heme exporter protein D
MNELTELMAHRHWPFIWPCYALAVAMFVALAVRAMLQLRKWEKAAREER